MLEANLQNRIPVTNASAAYLSYHTSLYPGLIRRSNNAVAFTLLHTMVDSLLPHPPAT